MRQESVCRAGFGASSRRCSFVVDVRERRRRGDKGRGRRHGRPSSSQGARAAIGERIAFLDVEKRVGPSAEERHHRPFPVGDRVGDLELLHRAADDVLEAAGAVTFLLGSEIRGDVGDVRIRHAELLEHPAAGAVLGEIEFAAHAPLFQEAVGVAVLEVHLDVGDVVGPAVSP